MPLYTPLTSAAIIAALGFVPSDAAGANMANGTAASPGMPFGSDTDTGIYRDSANILGIAAGGLQHTRFYYRSILGTNDNATIITGRNQTFSTGASAYAYPVTYIAPTYTITNGTPIVPHDFGLSAVVVGDTTTQTVTSYTVEIDKTDITQTGGAVDFTAGFGAMIVRVPIAKTGVTLANAYGIDFSIPHSADVTGTHTATKLIRFPSNDLGASSTYYGLYFEDEYNGGHIVSAQFHDLTIYSGRYLYLTAMPSGANGIVDIDAQGSGGVVRIRQNNRICAEFGTVGASLNRILILANNTPTIMPQHDSTANLQMILSSKGTSSLLLATNGGTTQATVVHTASAVNYVELRGGASGANARIGSSAENLAFGTGSAISTSATAGFIMIPGTAGTPSGAPTGAGAGALPLVYDTAANKLWIYNGSWRSVTLA